MTRSLLAFALAGVACGGGTPKEPPAPARPAHLKALAWRCTDVNVVFVPADGGRARLHVAEEVRDVTVRPTQFGLAWADDHVTFRMTDEEARLTLADVEQICLFDSVRSDFEDARIRGVAFRAVGSGFVVEIADKVVLTRGEEKVEIPAGVPVPGEGGVLTWSDASRAAFTVTATPATCFERGSGFASEWAVEVAIDGASLQGCGERLAGIEVN